MLIWATLLTLAGGRTFRGLIVGRTFKPATFVTPTWWFTGWLIRSFDSAASRTNVTTSVPIRAKAMMGTRVFMLME